MKDLELLSRWMDGDLPEAEAREVARRLQEEPELAAALATLQEVVTGLADLPEVPPPAWLDAAVLSTRPDTAPSPSPLPAMGWALLAQAAVLLLAVWAWKEDPPVVIAATGTTFVLGPAELLLGDRTAFLEGAAHVRVEPSDGLARGLGAQEEPMQRSTVLAALAGAVVTLTVTEGRARLVDAQGHEAVLAAGATTTFEVPGGRQRPTRSEGSSGPVSAEVAAERIAALEAENADLRQRLERAEVVAAVSQGQLARFQGDPVPWTEAVAAGWRPEAVQARLDAMKARHPELQVAALECDEFPCLVVVSAPSSGAEDHKALADQLVVELNPNGPDADPPDGVMVMVADAHGPEGEGTALVGVTFLPDDPAMQDRTRFRSETLMGALQDEVLPPRP